MYGLFKIKDNTYINEIDIRVWDNERKKMYYIKDFDKLNISLKELFEYKDYERNNQPKRYFPMLYTGEIDRNKKKIYQGDILKTSQGFFEVRFYNGAFALYNIELKQHFEYMCNISSMMGKVYEIVGNIFEKANLK